MIVFLSKRTNCSAQSHRQMPLGDVLKLLDKRAPYKVERWCALLRMEFRVAFGRIPPRSSLLRLVVSGCRLMKPAAVRSANLDAILMQVTSRCMKSVLHRLKHQPIMLGRVSEYRRLVKFIGTLLHPKNPNHGLEYRTYAA
jgi:hypothetical protein